METYREEITRGDACRTPADIAPSFISLNQAARSLPSGRNGRPTHTATLVRWVTNGSKGPDGEIVRLQAVRLGGRWLTTHEWLAEYASRMTPDFAACPSTPVRSSTARVRQATCAGATLDKIGF